MIAVMHREPIHKAPVNTMLIDTASGRLGKNRPSVPVANGGTGATTSSGALSNLGGVPNTTTVNGHPLSGNVTVTAADAGAVAKTNGLGCLDGNDHLPCTVYV